MVELASIQAVSVPRKRIQTIEELRSVYYIYGDEELLAEQAITRLKNLFAAEADADFNMEVVNAAEHGAEHVIDSAETMPLMASRRLVIARDVDRLSKKEQGLISDYLDGPNPDTTLVLVSSMPSAGGQRDSNIVKKVESSALFKKAMAVGGESLKFSYGARGRQKKVEDWVSDEFNRRGKRVEPDARDMMVARVGTELRDLADAVERICLYAADTDTITCEDVVKVVVPSAGQGVFELIDAVADRRRDIALYLLNRLMRQGESPQRIFSLLLRQYRLIARCKSMSHDHEYAQIASTLGIPPFLVGKCLKQATRFSPERLRTAFDEFEKAQVQLHSNRYLSDREYSLLILEMLIVKVIG
jgi:DNA polymerase III subunit delta